MALLLVSLSLGTGDVVKLSQLLRASVLPLSGAYMRLSLQLRVMRAPGVRSGGIKIVDLCGQPGNPRSHVGRLQDAVDLIAMHDPRWYRRLRQHVGAIACVYHPYAYATYIPAMRMVTVGDQVMSKYSDGFIASYIVHELTHARIAHCARQAATRNHPRIERRCYMEQREFVRRLPGEKPIFEWLEQLLANEPWLQLHEQEQEIAAAKEAMLEDAGVSRSVIRFLKAFVIRE
jgi:hypothetical protein